MRRQAVAFFLGDAAFVADPKFRALARRLPDPDDFNSAVGAFWIALAASRRNGTHRLDVASETESRYVDDLRAVGLLDAEGFPLESWREWDAMSPQQAAAGRARAASAERDERGRYAPSGPSESSALAPLDTDGPASPALPSPPFLSSTSTVEGGPGGERDSLDTYHEITGYRPWGEWSGDELRGAESEYGLERVVVALEAERAGERKTVLKRALARLAREAEHRQREAKERPKPVRPPEDRAAVNREIMRLMAEAKETA